MKPKRPRQTRREGEEGLPSRNQLLTFPPRSFPSTVVPRKSSVEGRREGGIIALVRGRSETTRRGRETRKLTSQGAEWNGVQDEGSEPVLGCRIKREWMFEVSEKDERWRRREKEVKEWTREKEGEPADRCRITER